MAARETHPPERTVREWRRYLGLRMYAVIGPRGDIVYRGPNEVDALLALTAAGRHDYHLWAADPDGDWTHIRVVPPASARPEETDAAL